LKVKKKEKALSQAWWLRYIGSSRLAWANQVDPVSKKEKKKA
jgi:hypothetical protein